MTRAQYIMSHFIYKRGASSIMEVFTMPSSRCVQEELADVLELKRQVDSSIVTIIIIIVLSDSTNKSMNSHGGYD